MVLSLCLYAHDSGVYVQRAARFLTREQSRYVVAGA